MRAVLPPHALLIDEPQIGLVHQRGGLQRVIRPLASHIGRGNPTKFALDRLDQAVASLGPSRTPLDEQRGQVGLSCAGAHVLLGKRLGWRVTRRVASLYERFLPRSAPARTTGKSAGL